jgi:hypothetical protein
VSAFKATKVSQELAHKDIKELVVRRVSKEFKASLVSLWLHPYLVVL